MTGQEAVNVAETFNTQLDVTGLLLTKVDGDARGGAALSIREAVGKPIKFISVGEKLDQLEAFYPDRMASRILQMGDVLTLMEKAQKSIDGKEAEKVAMQMMGGEFTLEMFLSTQTMMKKMGSMGDIMKMMGIGGMFGLSSSQQEELSVHGEKMLHLYETAINSMTVAERRKPETIDQSRRRRIARGSGLKESEVGRMLNEFEQMRGMFTQMRSMGLGGLFGGGGNPFGGGGGGGGGNPFGGGMPPMGGMGGGMPPFPGQGMPPRGGQQGKPQPKWNPPQSPQPGSGGGGGLFRKERKNVNVFGCV